MFKLFVVVFAALLALAVAGPKPQFLASPFAAAPAVAYNGIASPFAYNGLASPLAYSAGLAAPYAAYNAPIAATYY